MTSGGTEGRVGRRRLIYCRTPLQALIATAVQKQSPAHDTILYYPISGSPKHRVYFDRMTGAEKAFVDYRPENRPEVIHLLSAYRRVPAAIRTRAFDDYLFSSIGCLVLALLLREAPSTAGWSTFDDGLFNITDDILGDWIYREGLSRRLLKRALGGPSNVTLFERADVHYTIYDETMCLSPAPRIVRVRPFVATSRLAGATQVRIVIGTPPQFLSETDRRYYQRILDSGAFDVFIPHPAEEGQLTICNLRNAAALERRFQELIAEHIVAEIAAIGYRPEVIGFGSSVMANLAAQYTTINVDLGTDYGNHKECLRALGVPTLPPEQVFPGL